MQIGCHGLVWTGTFDEEGIRRSVEQTKRAGFDLIEFPLMDPYSFDAAVARSALDEHGLSATGSLGLAADTDVSSDDPEVVRAGQDLLRRALDTVAALDGKHLCGVLYSAMRKYDRPASATAVDRSQQAVADLADRAAGMGVTISLEVVNRYETNILNTAKLAAEFVGETGRDNLGIHLDTYHMNIEEPDMFSPVFDAGSALKYVHIGESHRGYLGTGSVDFDSFFKAIGRSEYDGPVVFESFSSAVVSPQLSNTLGIWRNLWVDGAELGAHANSYIRNALTAVRTIGLH